MYYKSIYIHFEQLSFLYNLGWLPSTTLFTSLQRHELSVAFKEQPLINTCEAYTFVHELQIQELCVCVCEKRSNPIL